MNILNQRFKLFCVCIRFILITACGQLPKFEWNEVKYNKIDEMINKNETFYSIFKRDDCPYCPEFLDNVKSVAKEKNLKIYIVETSQMSKNEKKDYSKKFKEKYVPVIYYVSNGEVKKNILGNITQEEMEKFIE